jgi:hypothetical protein
VPFFVGHALQRLAVSFQKPHTAEKRVECASYTFALEFIIITVHTYKFTNSELKISLREVCPIAA